MGKYTIIDAPTFSVENTEPYMGELKLKANIEYTGFNSNNLIVDFGKLETKGQAKANILFKNKEGFNDINIIACSSSCGCTVPHFMKQSNGDYLITIGVDLKRMSSGKNTKIVKITMADKRVMKIEMELYGL